MTKLIQSKPKTMVEFNGQSYFDDRLFVLYLCKATVKINENDFVTTIYHGKAPQDHIRCLVTYRNYSRYPLYSVKHFATRAKAIIYMQHIEPETPLISLDGQSPDMPLSYEEYISLKKENKFKDYVWKTLYTLTGSKNARENIYQTKEQFEGIR